MLLIDEGVERAAPTGGTGHSDLHAREIWEPEVLSAVFNNTQSMHSTVYSQ